MPIKKILPFGRKAEKTKTYKCRKCDKIYISPTDLRDHINVIHCGIIFDCKFCDHVAGSEFNLHQHITTTHQN